MGIKHGVDVMTLFEVDNDNIVAPEILIIRLRNSRAFKCYLCGQHSPRSINQYTCNGRQFYYAVCQSCKQEDDWQNRIEQKIKVELPIRSGKDV